MKNKLVLKHLQLVLETNKKLNLTNIKDPAQAKILHIEDSLYPLKFINEMPSGDLLDIGSGAGYPGIPLAIYTKRKTTLCESIEKKAKSLKYFTNKLEIDSYVNVVNDRVENLKDKYLIVTARAVTSLPSLLELSSPLLLDKGILIAYKNKECEEELEKAIKLQKIFGMKFIKKETYTLNNTTIHNIILFKKISEPLIKLPRKPGFAQKKPYRVSRETIEKFNL